MKVEVRDREIIVTNGGFCAAYYKPAGQPQLILKHRTRTDDHELLAKAWKAASDKARELGWIF
jgi:hypothetical protein